MSERPQVRLDEAQIAESRRKLDLIRGAAMGSYPTAQIAVMLREIEAGYLRSA